jgi:hypothetical protein
MQRTMHGRRVFAFLEFLFSIKLAAFGGQRLG